MLTQFYTPRFSYLRRILVLPLAAFIFCSLAFVADKHPSAIRVLATTSNHEPITPEVAATAPLGDTTPVKKPKPVNTSNEIFTFVEHPPMFKGGEDSLAHYLSHNIRYPKIAYEKNTAGTVFAQFVVDKDGTIKDVKTIGAKKGNGLEEEAIRVIKSMPKWTPGRQNGRNVAVQFNLPIRFVLEPANVQFTPPNSKEEIFTFVDQPPTFPGGEEAMAKYLSKNIRYPRAAQEHGAKGTIFVQYIVNNDGTLRDVATVGAKKGYGLEEEAIRVVKAMPRWKPGKQNGRLVTVQYNLPIRFTLVE